MQPTGRWSKRLRAIARNIDVPQMRLRASKVKSFLRGLALEDKAEQHLDGKTREAAGKRPGEISRGGEPLLDLSLVHEHRAFGVSYLIDDESQFEEATRALQRLDLRLLHGTAPMRVIGMTVHVPPDCPIQGRSPSVMAIGLSASDVRRQSGSILIDRRPARALSHRLSSRLASLSDSSIAVPTRSRSSVNRNGLPMKSCRPSPSSSLITLSADINNVGTPAR
jgi:hypothetical protein